VVAEAITTQPVVVASAAEGDGPAVATPAARPTRPAADRTPVRAAVASAAGASSTTTPSPLSRGSAAAAALPPATQAYASAQGGKTDHRLPGLSETAAVRHEAPAPAAHAEAAAAPRREPARPAASAWVIQLGAVDDESEAKTLLQDAKSRSGRALAQASAFTEKVVRDGTTLYRARFSGFDEAEEAQQACRTLKRSGFNCFATRS